MENWRKIEKSILTVPICSTEGLGRSTTGLTRERKRGFTTNLIILSIESSLARHPDFRRIMDAFANIRAHKPFVFLALLFIVFMPTYFFFHEFPK